MKKFTFKGVLDGLRQSVQTQAARQELEVPDLLRPEHFTLKRTFRHGFPYAPTTFTFDSVQKLMAIGDKSGNLRILGRHGVDVYVKHDCETEYPVLLSQFLVNEGSLITVTADDMMHLWNLRLNNPQVVQSLKFQRERVTCLHIPVGSKWIYVGTEKGNVHVVNVHTFVLSGYIINWNKAIELVRTTHPGATIALCDNPIDANKLLIAFECGLLVLWDLRAKCAEIRWQASEPIKSIAWNYDGKYFISSHEDGSICSWPTKPTTKPQSVIYPHARGTSDGLSEKCTTIHKVDLKGTKSGETFTIFSGGTITEKGPKSTCITILQGKTVTVLEMEHPVVDFITLCENPWPCETQEPYAVAVLLQYDLVLIDLLTQGYPCFESPYPMDLHESPVTCCSYLTDCPSDLVPAFYSVGRNTINKKANFSEKEWPISGGEWLPVSCSYSEIVITGHQDGSIRFWDSGAGTLQILYKVKTAKIFEKSRSIVNENTSDWPLAIQLIYLCAQSRRLCISGSMGHVLLFKFRKSESNSDIIVLEIPILYEDFDDLYGPIPDCDFDFQQVFKYETCELEKEEYLPKIRHGVQRKLPGFQCQLACFTTCSNKQNVPVTALSLNSYYGLMSYGTENGIVVIDIVQKLCLLSVATPDLYGAYDPYSRTPRSPKKDDKEDQSGSPSSEQINGGDAATQIGGNRESFVDAATDNRSAIETNSVECDVFSYTNSGISRSQKFISDTESPATDNITNSDILTTAFITEASPYIKPTEFQAETCESLKTSKSQDKLDGSFSKSRSSSISSIDMSSSESVTCLTFIDSPAKKTDALALVPTLWIGTSFGSVLTLLITVPDKDIRKTNPVLITINGGPVVRAKGSITTLSFLDALGALIPNSFEHWLDVKEKKREKTPPKSSRTSPICTPTATASSPTFSSAVTNSCVSLTSSPTSCSINSVESTTERQYIIIACEKQIIVFDLINKCFTNRVQFSEMDFVVKSETISMKGGSCIVIYLSNGHIAVYSLPGLRPLLDSEFLPLTELSFQKKCDKAIVDPMLAIWGQQIIVNDETAQISKIFCFSRKGHGLYMASPTEIQKFTTSAEFCQFLMEMKYELFTVQTMPEQPKESFIKGLFGGGTRALDRDELFGEQKGKANRSVAKYIPGSSLEQLGQKSSTAASEISRAHQLALERGEKLSELEEKAERMSNQAQEFSGTAQQLMHKYKDKKWYQL